MYPCLAGFHGDDVLVTGCEALGGGLRIAYGANMPDVLGVRRACSFLGGFLAIVVHAGDAQRGADPLEHGVAGDSLAMPIWLTRNSELFFTNDRKNSGDVLSVSCRAP